MKLYTEEQLREAFNCGRLYLGREGDTNFDQFIDKITPIELPSDEEIEKEQKNKFTIEFIKWLYDNEYYYNRKQKMYLKTYIFGSKFFTIEELFILFNETYGGNK